MNLQRLFYTSFIILLIGGCGINKKVQHKETSFDEGIGQIKHLVVIYMENRSFDNLYGEFKGANGIKNAKKAILYRLIKMGSLMNSCLKSLETTLSLQTSQMHFLISTNMCPRTK